MSCLSKSHRINTHKEFNKIYKSNKKWYTTSFVVFYIKSDNLNIAFVSSKKVGNAVQRNRTRRVLRAIILNNEKKLQNGKYVFVSKKELLAKSSKDINKDFNYAMKKLNLFKPLK